MFFVKTPSGAVTKLGRFWSPCLRVEISVNPVRPESQSTRAHPEWLSELSEVVDTLPDLVATFDRDGRLLMINAAGVEMLGHPDEQLKEFIISDLYPDADAERLLAETLQESTAHGSWSGCAPLLRADGEIFDTHQRWVAHQPEQSKATAFTLVARPLDESCADIEVRNRRETLAAMSLGFVHDVNNILGPIATYADLTATTVSAGSPAIRYLDQIARAAERGRVLSARLADLARGREPSQSPVDVLEIAREIVGWLRVSRPDVLIEVTKGYGSTTVIGDPIQLHQVVMNVGRNAVEALSDRPGSVRIHIDHANPLDNDDVVDRFLRLAVHDDGPGIEERVLSRVFDPFFSTKDDGAGLGLNVSREIVRAHGGVITIEPSEPRGTTATIYLPLPLAPDGSPPDDGIWF